MGKSGKDFFEKVIVSGDLDEKRIQALWNEDTVRCDWYCSSGSRKASEVWGRKQLWQILFENFPGAMIMCKVWYAMIDPWLFFFPVGIENLWSKWHTVILSVFYMVALTVIQTIRCRMAGMETEDYIGAIMVSSQWRGLRLVWQCWGLWEVIRFGIYLKSSGGKNYW